MVKKNEIIRPTKNVIAMDLRSPKYAKKVIPNKKKQAIKDACRKNP